MRVNFSFHLTSIIVILFTTIQLSWAQPSAGSAASNENQSQGGPSVTIELPVVTQGPFWPPSELVDKDGNFIVVGNIMTGIAPGIFVPVPNQAVLVSKETVPPLDANGVEDPDNWFGAAYKVIRPLDLRPGSPDLEIVLYSNSFGPVAGPHGKAPRIPRAGESTYNLNGDLEVCKEVFPADSQRFNYTRPSFPLHKVPVLGFQGDQVAYDVNTGQPFDPQTATNCPFPNCPGEDPVDERREDPITLGEWLKAKGEVKITLTRFNQQLNAYTHARFDFELKNMLPNSLYTIWAIRLRTLPALGRRDIDPLSVPNVIVTDANGKGEGSFEVRNPFPDPATDIRGRRIIGLSIVYHSDHQTWGACFDRFGPGVGAHAVFSTLGNGTVNMTDFITKDAP